MNRFSRGTRADYRKVRAVGRIDWYGVGHRKSALVLLGFLGFDWV